MPESSDRPASATIETGEQTCETLIRSVRKAMTGLQPGAILAVCSLDPSARLDLPAWCRMTGHSYLGSEDCENQTIHYLRKREEQHGENTCLR